MARSKATTRTRSSASVAPLQFEGPPDAVEGFVPVDPQRRREVSVSISGDDGWTPVRVLTAPAGHQTLVRLVLPADTPSTEFEAAVEAGEDRYPAVVRTTIQAALDCTPAVLDLDVEGSTATASVAVVNLGNVPVVIPDIAAFGVIQEGALETAIGTALMAKETGVERVGRAADALAERHGGLARLAVESGAGPLEPGASTTVRARIHLSDGLTNSRRYHGVWPLATLRIPVSFRIPERPRPATRARRTTKKGAAK
jgi:hypothetical protein